MNVEWFEELHKCNQSAFETFNRPMFRGIFDSMVDKYSSEAHFIYELLQNADDAEATEAEIELYPDKFLFIHNGTRRFTLSNPNEKQQEKDRKSGTLGDINAITAIAYSSKGQITSDNKIGKFGIGFKAVFSYTSTPHIYDDPYCFKIEHYIVPTLLEDTSMRRKGRTVICLPFDKQGVPPEKAFEKIRGKLAVLQCPQLFLNHLRKITWRIDGHEEGSVEMCTEKVYSEADDILPTLYSIQYKEKTERVLMMTTFVRVTNVSHRISIAYYLNDKGEIETKDIQPICCFFPTKEKIETCYAIHAPFLLSDNREKIKEGSENENLFGHIGRLAAHSLISLKNIGLSEGKKLLNDNIVDLVHNKLENIYERPLWNWQDDKSQIIDRQFAEVLNSCNLFLSREGEYLTLEEGAYANKDIRNLLTDPQLRALTGDTSYRSFILCDVSQRKIREIMKRVTIFDEKDIANHLTNSFMKRQADEWRDKLYHFVLDKGLVKKESWGGVALLV